MKGEKGVEMVVSPKVRDVRVGVLGGGDFALFFCDKSFTVVKVSLERVPKRIA